MINTLDEVEIKPIAVGSHNTDEYIGIWNTTKGLLEGVVQRKNSTVMPHKQAFNVFIKAVTDKGLQVHGVLKNDGGLVILNAIFDGEYIDDGSKQGINLGVTISNDYCSRSGPVFKGSGYGFRVVCSNGMVLKDIVSTVVKKHEKVAEIQKIMAQLVESIELGKTKLKSIINDAKHDEILDLETAGNILLGEVGSKRKVKHMLDKLESQDSITRYTLYNAITQYATFNSNDEDQRNRLQTVAQRVLTTSADKLKTKDWDED